MIARPYVRHSVIALRHSALEYSESGLAKTTIPPLRRSGFCLFDEKPLDFGGFAWFFVLHVAPTKPATGAKFDVL